MLTRLSRWFGRPSVKPRRQPPIRRARPGVESLESRLVPNALPASMVLNNGVLNVTADPSMTKGVRVRTYNFSDSGVDSIVVFAVDLSKSSGTPGASVSKTFTSSQVRNVVFFGGPGADIWNGTLLSKPQELHAGNGDNVLLQSGPMNDSLFAGTGRNDVLEGGAGNDLLTGNSGHAILRGQDGDDRITGGMGTDVLDGGSGANTFLVGVANNLLPVGPHDTVSGLLNRDPTPAEMDQVGALIVRQLPGVLVINGPSNIGFQVRGTFTTTPLPNGGFRYNASTATLQTSAGDVPVFGGVTVTTKSGSAASLGVIDSFSLTMRLDDRTQNIIARVADFSGIDFLTNANRSITFTLALGKDLPSNNSAFNPAVPYLYVTAAGNLVTFNNNPVTKFLDGQAFVAIDPSDISVTVIALDFGLGVSLRGRIPFHPDTPVPGVSGLIPTSATPFRGNLWLKGETDVGAKYISAEGSTVVKLNYQMLDRSPQLSGGTLGAIMNHQNPKALDTLFSDGLQHFQIGVNGAVTLGYQLGGLGLKFPMGEGTVLYSNGGLGFVAASHGDPFAGTPLAGRFLFNNPTWSTRGLITSSSVDVDLKVDKATLAGFNISDLALHFGTSRLSMAMTLNASLPFIGGASLRLAGSYTANGEFAIGLVKDFRINIGVSHFTGSVSFALYVQGGKLTFQASIYAEIEPFDAGIATVRLAVTGKLLFTASSSGVSLSGSGKAEGSAGALSIDLGFGFSKSGFSLDLPDPLPTLTVDF